MIEYVSTNTKFSMPVQMPPSYKAVDIKRCESSVPLHAPSGPRGVAAHLVCP